MRNPIKILKDLKIERLIFIIFLIFQFFNYSIAQENNHVSVERGSTTELTWKASGDYSAYDSLYFVVKPCTSNTCARLIQKKTTKTYSEPYTTMVCTLYVDETASFNAARYYYSIYAYGPDTVWVTSGNFNLMLNGQTPTDGVPTETPYYTIALNHPSYDTTFIIGYKADSTWAHKNVSQVRSMLNLDTNQVDANFDSLYTKTSHIVNVKEFGAVGDSLTDDTQAIRDAVAFCSGGKTLYIPKGIYRYTASSEANEIEMDGLHDITIIGEGKESIIECSGATARLFDITNTHNLIFDNFTVRGNFTTQTGNNQLQAAIHSDNWIAPDSTYNIRIQNMFFDDLGGDAIQFNRATTDVRIINNTWEDGLGFVQLIAELNRPNRNIIIEGNTILGTSYSTRDISGMPSGSDDIIDSWGQSEDIIIRNNFFDARREIADTNGVGRGVLIIQNPPYVYGRTRNVLIEGNTFLNFHNSDEVYYIQGAIAVENNGFTDSVDMDVTIRGNYIMQGGQGMGIRLYYMQDPTIIEDNVIFGCMYGIYVENDPADTLMSHNIIRNNYISGFSRYGLWLDDNGTLVQNNEFVLDSLENGFGYTGLYKHFGDSCYIIGNTFRDGDSASNAYAGWGIFWAQGGDDCRIEDNSFLNLNRGGVLIYQDSTTNRLAYKNNYFKRVTVDLDESVTTYDIFDLNVANDDRYYADRYYLGDKEYLESDGLEIDVINDAGKITELTHNFAQTTPYEVVNETAFSRIQADVISGFYINEQKPRQGQLLNPALEDTINIWLNTDGQIYIDSVRLVSDDSARVQVYFGSDSLFDNPELVITDTTISTFDTQSILANKRVKLFFTELGDGLTDFNYLIYYRDRGSDSFAKNYLLNTFLDRVVIDGGTIIDTSAISDFYDMVISNGILDSITLAWSTTFAVKMDADSNIIKLYDASLFRNDIYQPDTTYSPDFQLSGITTASFDGTDDYMQKQIEGMGQPETVFLVGGTRTWVNGRYFMDGYNSQSGALLMISATPAINIMSGGLNGCQGSNSTTIGSAGLFVAVFDGANSSLWSSSYQITTTCSLGVESMDGITLGKISNLEDWSAAPVDLTEQIILNVNASATLRTAIQTYLNTKYGL